LVCADPKSSMVSKNSFIPSWIPMSVSFTWAKIG